MAHEKLWTEKSTMDAAEKAYHEYMSKVGKTVCVKCLVFRRNLKTF